MSDPAAAGRKKAAAKRRKAGRQAIELYHALNFTVRHSSGDLDFDRLMIALGWVAGTYAMGSGNATQAMHLLNKAAETFIKEVPKRERAARGTPHE